MEIDKSWIVVSIDGVLADPSHREHLRPQYRKGQIPSRHERDAWMTDAIDDAPVEQTVAMVKALMAAGHQLMLIGSLTFPVKDWFRRYMPDTDMSRVAHIAYRRHCKSEGYLDYLSYEEQVFVQLKALRDAGGKVTMALLAAPTYQSIIRYLFPEAIVGSATSTEGKAAERRSTSMAAGLDLKHRDVSLELRFYEDQHKTPWVRPPTPPRPWFVNYRRWLRVDPLR